MDGSMSSPVTRSAAAHRAATYCSRLASIRDRRLRPFVITFPATWRTNRMFRMRNYFKWWLALGMVAMTGAWIAVAQQRRQVDDSALKTGSKNGDEWIAY